MNGGFDTIAAIATAPGASAIGIVRISGDTALSVTERVFVPRSGSLTERESGGFIRGTVRDGAGNILDDCVAVVFRGNNGYTGEPSAELHCHGSPVVLAAVLRAVFAAGARQARAGEFTKRAFLNGKIDLTGAEAVADLIDAETEQSARNAAAQLQGAISRRVSAVYSELLDITAHFHAAVDYTDEDIDEFEIPFYAGKLCKHAEDLSRLAATFERGRVMKNGIPAAIAGKPNTGKSSLLNALLGYDRAIVTANAGTTRDTLEEKLIIGGELVRITDTAGIREAEDEAERLGIRRAVDAVRVSAIVFAVFDGSAPLSGEDYAVIASLPDSAVKIAVINKSDLPQVLDAEAVGDSFDAKVSVSAATGAGLDDLIAKTAAWLPALPDVPCGEIITNERQFDAVTRAAAALTECAADLQNGVTPDAALFMLESALTSLGELDGRNIREDTVERIFSRFCVGK